MKVFRRQESLNICLVGFESSIGLGLLEYDPEELATTVKGIYVWGKGIDHFLITQDCGNWKVFAR